MKPVCRGWQGRLAGLGRAVQGRLPGFMVAPSTTPADPTNPATASLDSPAATPEAPKSLAPPSSSSNAKSISSKLQQPGLPPDLKASSSSSSPSQRLRSSVEESELAAPQMAGSEAGSAAADNDEMHMSLQETTLLPPITLMSSIADFTVPW